MATESNKPPTLPPPDSKGIDGYGTYEQVRNVAQLTREGKVPLITNFDTVKDSGKREEFATGSVRDTQDGKGRYDLIPVGPLKRLSKHYENGAKKYGDRNWEKGQPSSRYYSSAMRHLTNYMAGDRSEDHLAAVAWNAFAMMFNEDTKPELNDIKANNEV